MIDQQVVELYRQGISIVKIAQQLHRGFRYIRAQLKAAGVATRQGKLTTEQIAWAGAQSQEGVPRRQLAQQLGVTTCALAYQFDKLGIARPGKNPPKNIPMSGDEICCNICRQFKPLDAFAVFSRARRGRAYSCRTCMAEVRRFKYYGMTQAAYAVLLDQQHGGCAICQQTGKLVVDHNHSTGATRGLLCDGCNTWVGGLKDDPSRLEAVQRYIATSKTGLFIDKLLLGPGPLLQADRSRAINYGLSPAAFQALKAARGGRCYCCGDKYVPIKKFPDLLVEHAHSSGEIRGLACYHCNVAIARQDEHPELVAAAAAYLRQYATATPVICGRPNQITMLSPTAAMIVAEVPDYTYERLVADGLPPLVARQWFASQYQAYAQKGVHLYVFWAHERSERLDAIIAYKVGGAAVHRLNARDCTLAFVESAIATAFYEQHHLQGSCNGRIHYGLFDGQRLVACMSFSAASACRSNLAETVLQRYATVGNIRGGASRLLTAFRRDNPGVSIVSYSDNRYATGKLYETLGFTLSREGRPDYAYWDGERLINKSAKQKLVLFRELDAAGISMPEDATEEQMARRLGYLRIYDCGKKTWILAGQPTSTN